MRIKLEGTAELQRKLDAVKEAGPMAAVQTLWETGQQILAVAVQDYVPRDTGALANSAASETTDTGTETIVTIGFGGVAGSGNFGGQTNTEDVGYALVVHEDLIVRHVVGQAKYLEIPYRAAVEGIGGVLRARVRDAIKTAAQGARYARLRTPEALAAFWERRARRAR